MIERKKERCREKKVTENKDGEIDSEQIYIYIYIYRKRERERDAYVTAVRSALNLCLVDVGQYAPSGHTVA